MRRLELGMVVRRDGVLYEVIATSDGPVAYLRAVERHTCPACGASTHPDVSVVDASHLARGFKPVTTPED